MEQSAMMSIRTYVTRFLVVIGCMLIPFTGRCNVVTPDDLPTHEALIDLHKKIKSDEDAALKRLATSTAIQDMIATGSEKFKTARATLDSKLNNAYSYVMLAAALSTTAASLYQLSTEYADFTVNTYNYVAKKPFVAWYYMNANAAIVREVKHCRNLYMMMAASGLNIWRASMSDKINLVYTLKTSIDRARSILYNANIYCYLIVNTDWHPDYIWEILTSDLKDEIVERLIHEWNSRL